MNQTINISLPPQLKIQAEELIEQGHFSSFSDVVRSALRNLVQQSKYDLWTMEAKREEKAGKTTILKTKKDIDAYIDRVFDEANAI